MYDRTLNLKELIKHKSLLLFGARQTGKSTLLKQTFPEAKIYDLLKSDVYHQLSVNPALIREQLSSSDRIIIIDEIQKKPELLDEVHYLIEKHKELRFILTGSSARGLKKKGANLLAGRAWVINLFPLTSKEIDFKNIDQLINRGGLPAIFDSDFYLKDLESYVGTYLKEEIVAEGLARKLQVFTKFLSFASHYNTEQVNFTNIASDLGVAPNTIREYFNILEDTLVGSMLAPFQGTSKRKSVSKSKFYFFDLGVTNFLLNRQQVTPGSEIYGKAMEQLVFLELKSYLSYSEKSHCSLNYWRTVTQIEVDFIVNGKVAIEVKSSANIQRKDCKGLLALKEEASDLKMIIVSNDPEKRQLENGVTVYPLGLFLKELWSGKLM